MALSASKFDYVTDCAEAFDILAKMVGYSPLNLSLVRLRQSDLQHISVLLEEVIRKMETTNAVV